MYAYVANIGSSEKFRALATLPLKTRGTQNMPLPTMDYCTVPNFATLSTGRARRGRSTKNSGALGPDLRVGTIGDPLKHDPSTRGLAEIIRSRSTV